MGGDDEDGGPNFLAYGHTLAFYAEEGDGYLAAEGFADERCLLYHNQGEAKTRQFSGDALPLPLPWLDPGSP